MRLASHEWIILVFGVLCGVTAAVVGAWVLLRFAIVDELDLGLPVALGVLLGVVIGGALVVVARRARL